jgi:hypothetical protein
VLFRTRFGAPTKPRAPHFEPHGSPRSRLAQVPAWAYAPALIAGGAAIPILGKHLGLMREPVGTAVVTAAMLALVLPGTLYYWRRLDEAAKEAHKFAWYWGGTMGLLVAFVTFAAITASGGELITTGLHGHTTPEAFVALGVIGVLAPQLVGYAVAWAGWWVAKR